MPYMVMILCFVLGACFHQSRISFISLFLTASMMLLSHAAFDVPDDRRLNTLIFLVSVYYPLLALIFYFMREQGILSVQGYLKIAIVLSALVVLLLLPKIPSLTDALAGRNVAAIVRPVAGWLKVPLMGMAVFLCCLPLFIAVRGREGGSAGPLLACSVAYVFMGMSFRGSLWESGAARSAFVLFFSGAGAAMIWLVLESAWRHANIDELTQLSGRRAFNMRMERLHRGYGLAVVDIDHFKKINDRYGHDTGDQVLRYIASQMRKSGAGHVYRYGGEEFVIVAAPRDIKEFCASLDDMRDMIGSRPFGIRGIDRPKKKRKSGGTAGSSEKIRVTVSVGAAVQSPSHSTPDEVLQAADKALYRAKRGGRNQVMAAR
jgi:diguanylate cyclase (GGDEF)-like protein